MLSEKTAKEKENLALFAQYRENKDVATRNRLVENYLFLVDILIRKYLNKGVDYDDLYQIGSMALVLAVERFDSSKGYAFSSFATPTIIGEIKRYFRDKGWSIKVSRTIQEIVLNLPFAKDELSRQLNRPPTIPELSAYMGYSEDEILEAMESGRNYNAYSLNQALEESRDDGESNVLEGFVRIDEKGYRQLEDAEIIQNVINRLTENEKLVFLSRLIHKRTQRDVAHTLHVSQMTVSRMENDIKRKLKTEYLK
ncbi:MAG: sigma-70 family RNA polymerase sigma factor [Clostridiales Family XIII bacterium]|nr:sigma-70 family RNA polymerase sigma factor [Clostridiales Family XIII bacterium]